MAKEILYVKQILDSIGVEVELPIKIYCDNVGAIYMSTGTTNSPKTRHVSMKYYFTKELIEDGLIELIFVRTEDNEADIFTKNLMKRLFDQHASKMEEEVPEEYMDKDLIS